MIASFSFRRVWYIRKNRPTLSTLFLTTPSRDCCITIKNYVCLLSYILTSGSSSSSSVPTKTANETIICDTNVQLLTLSWHFCQSIKDFSHFFRDKRKRPREDVHEIREIERMRRAMELTNVKHIILHTEVGLEHIRTTAKKVTDLEQ